ncbi:MAG: carbohydrate kinase family protein [Anaerolineales bacterium]
MRIVLTGSIAFDYLMTFPGRFKDHILLERLERLSLSFLVDSLVQQRGGIAANIGYTMALLGQEPAIMASAGKDFHDYKQWLEKHGVNTEAIKIYPDLYTASFFVSTDETNAQIASFYSGAMARAAELSLHNLPEKPELVMVSANDPSAMESCIEECRQLGIPYMYDPSQQTVRLEAAPLKDGIRSCEALFVNDYEFELIRDKTRLTIDQILQNSAFVVITEGEKGASIHAKDGVIKIPAVEPSEIVDPTGVGDAFRAGFLCGYLNDFSLERCGQMGSVAASFCLENQGPQGHHFSIASFQERFQQNFDDQGDLEKLA